MPHSTLNGVNGSTANRQLHEAGKHHPNGFTEPLYSAEGVKEAPFYSGRGRPLRVVCIGAGAAGIYLGIKLPRSFREGAVDLQVS